MKTFYLSKSSRKDKKFMLVMDTMTHHFGASGYKDFTLMNNRNSTFYEPKKEIRDKTKRAYLARHRGYPKGIHSPSTMSDMFLWSAPTLAGGIKNYEKKYNVNVIYRR